jgi:signal transduction histidine kinase
LDIITVYFFYGLSFFSMGLAVMLEVGRSSELDFARALRSLAWFGVIHGSHEWMEMFLLIYPQSQGLPIYKFLGLARVILLAISFLFLISFGSRLIAGTKRNKLAWQMLGIIAFIWAAGLLWLFLAEPMDSNMVAADVYTRYSLAIPGAALTAWGLFLQQQKFQQAGMKGYGQDVIIAALAFGLYGGIGQLFAAPSFIFPSPLLNSATFLNWFGFPIQFFRSIMACIAAISIIRSLRAFEEETRRQIASLSNAQQAERQRLDELRAELLRRTVRAQELERQRIARELHDEIGQTLTALGMGLRAISDGASSRPERVNKQARELESVVDTGLSGLQNLIMGLHPPQLDDFGLMAALRWFSSQVKDRFGLTVTVTSRGDEAPLAEEIRTVLYRIVQESIINVTRHAHADHAGVLVVFDEHEVNILVEDNGSGFDVDTTLNKPGHPCWGLLGMKERAALVGGECVVLSTPGAGTLIQVCMPLNKEPND